VGKQQPAAGFILVDAVLAFSTCRNCVRGGKPMEWTTPQHEEIDLNCEISSYASAEL
jgi:hypothetical protein